MTAPPPPEAAPRKVILDCDPGIDDAFAIAFGCGHPGLELCGVTTVAGNVGLGRTTRNALAVLEFLGRADVPVAAGSAAPLLRPFVEAHDVHGETGLGAASLPAPSGRPVAAHAVDFLIERIAAAPGEVTLVATGPLTNVALAVRRHPPLVTQVADFVIMGGSAGRGNVTPAAEFNIWCDPEAAAIVFAAGWRVTMAGLDVTHQALATAEVRGPAARAGQAGRRAAAAEPARLPERRRRGGPAGARCLRARPGRRARPVRLPAGPGRGGDAGPVDLLA